MLNFSRFSFGSSPALRIIFAGLTIGLLTGCSCTDPRKPDADKKTPEDRDIAMSDSVTSHGGIEKAVANVKGIKDSPVNGTVTFTKVPGGIKIVADLEGLKPGEHGFHIHEFGDCGDKGSAAGGHFNPTGHKHGGPDSPERHLGDLGNIVADKKGHGHYERVDKLIALEGEYSIIGRSVIIHADPDDFTSQPAGNSGDRIGCGIIEPPSDTIVPKRV